MASKNRRQYGRALYSKGGRVSVLFEEQSGWRSVGATIVDQSEGGLQLVADSVKILVGSLTVIKTEDGSWPMTEREAAAKVVWVEKEEESDETKFGCEYIAPFTGIPEFF